MKATVGFTLSVAALYGFPRSSFRSSRSRRLPRSGFTSPPVGLNFRR